MKTKFGAYVNYTFALVDALPAKTNKINIPIVTLNGDFTLLDLQNIAQEIHQRVQNKKSTQRLPRK